MEDKKENTNPGIFEKVRGMLGLYGIVYIFVLIALVVVGTVYLSKIDYLTSSTMTPFAADTSTATKIDDLQMKAGMLSPPVDVMQFLNPSEEILSKGQQLYQTQCASCHGNEGYGDGPAGVTLNPAPRNLHDLNGWTNGPGFDEIYVTLQEGIINRGMASYSNLPPEDRLAIISYLRTFSPEYPPVTESDLQTLDVVYSLAAGTMTPNQIPVALAMQKLIEDYQPTEARINSLAERVKADNSSQAQLFKRMTTDVKRALRSLSSNSKWNENVNAFVNFVVTDPVQKGFRSEITDLGSEQWSQLFNFVRGLMGQPVTNNEQQDS